LQAARAARPAAAAFAAPVVAGTPRPGYETLLRAARTHEDRARYSDLWAAAHRAGQTPDEFLSSLRWLVEAGLFTIQKPAPSGSDPAPEPVFALTQTGVATIQPQPATGAVAGGRA
jgi:hypothetical protein